MQIMRGFLFLMMVLNTLIGFVIGVVRCPWSAWRSLKSLVKYAAVTLSGKGGAEAP